MNRQKILLVSPVLDIGGAEKVVHDIAFYADRKKYEIHLLILQDRVGLYEQQLLMKGCKAFHIPEPSDSYVAYFRALLTIMDREHYHAVHAHTMFSIGWVMLAARIKKVPVRIAHSHSALDNGDRWIKRVYERVMQFLILRCSTDLVACGEAAGIRLFGEKEYRRKGNLVLNGIDVNAFSYHAEAGCAIRNRLGLGNRFVLGHAGHLAEVKNQKFLLDLMPELLKKRPDAMLLLLGEGDDRPMLEAKIRTLKLENHVIMTGNVTNVPDYLSAMDVFVFPSLFEGMPLSILEVQANGLPCVISDSVPEDVFLTDLIHPLSLSATQEQWIDAILSVHRSNPQVYARELADSGFSVETAMEKIYRIYRKEAK